ncbi:MAG TPA: DUF1993 domain-containing protein [Rhizomicrobium sp.]
MAGEFYNLAAPQFLQILSAQSRIFAKAETLCGDRREAEPDWLGLQLYPDMQPLSFQVRQLLNHSAGAITRLRGERYPKTANPNSFAECRATIAAGIAEISAVKPAELDGAEDREVVFETPSGPLRFAGSTYLMSFAFPNFYFHASIAYAILRQKGLPIGKGDFLSGGWGK